MDSIFIVIVLLMKCVWCVYAPALTLHNVNNINYLRSSGKIISYDNDTEMFFSENNWEDVLLKTESSLNEIKN